MYKSNNNNIHLTTPKEFIAELENELNVKLTDQVPLYGEEFRDCLIEDWDEYNFVNPPFNNIEPFIHKAIVERQKGCNSYLLVPTNSSSKYWQEWVFPFVDELRFYAKKLIFKSEFAVYTQPFSRPLSLLIYDQRNMELQVENGEKLFTGNNITKSKKKLFPYFKF
jgi:hypothetical protein